jgi:hypothetical protein
LSICQQVKNLFVVDFDVLEIDDELSMLFVENVSKYALDRESNDSWVIYTFIEYWGKPM